MPLKLNLQANDLILLEPYLKIVNKTTRGALSFKSLIAARHVNFVKMWEKKRLNLVVNRNSILSCFFPFVKFCLCFKLIGFFLGLRALDENQGDSISNGNL